MEKCDKKNSRVQTIRTLSRMLNNLRHLLTFYLYKYNHYRSHLSIYLSLHLLSPPAVHHVHLILEDVSTEEPDLPEEQDGPAFNAPTYYPRVLVCWCT